MMKVENVSFREKLTSGAFGRTFRNLREEESYRVSRERWTNKPLISRIDV